MPTVYPVTVYTVSKVVPDEAHFTVRASPEQFETVMLYLLSYIHITIQSSDEPQRHLSLNHLHC